MSGWGAKPSALARSCALRVAAPAGVRTTGVRIAGRRRWTAALCLAAAVAATPSHAQETFAIHGSNTVGAELMPSLIEGYALSEGFTLVRQTGADPLEERFQGLFGLDTAFSVDLQRRGSSTGFKGLAAGEAVIGMSSRRIRDAEAESLGAQFGAEMRDPKSEHVIALDGIVVIVSPANPLTTITLDTVARIFAGEITDWAELGQTPGRISLHARDSESGTYDTFESLILDPADVGISPSAARYASNEELATTVAADLRAIGVTTLGVADLAKTVPIAMSCGMVIGPSAFSVKAEEYPLGRRLFLYTAGDPPPGAVRGLIDYAASDAAQLRIGESGFVDQSVQIQERIDYADHLMGAALEAEDELEKNALRRFVQATRAADRLSTTFRFDERGELLDAKAVADAARLARWMEEPENAGATVTLMGFYDDTLDYLESVQAAQTVADAARRAVLVQVSRAFNPERLRVEAYGGIAPVACNDAAPGRRANRRAEAWVSR